MIHFLIIAPKLHDEAKQAAVLGEIIGEQVNGSIISILCEGELVELFPKNKFECRFTWQSLVLSLELKEQFFDYVIDFDSSWRSWRVKSRIGAIDFTFGQHFLWGKLPFAKQDNWQGKDLLKHAIEKLSFFDIQDMRDKPTSQEE